MKSIQFSNVFVQSSAACVGPMEGKGPLGKYFDYISQDLQACATIVANLDEKMLSLNEAIMEAKGRQEKQGGKV